MVAWLHSMTSGVAMVLAWLSLPLGPMQHGGLCGLVAVRDFWCCYGPCLVDFTTGSNMTWRWWWPSCNTYDLHCCHIEFTTGFDVTWTLGWVAMHDLWCCHGSCLGELTFGFNSTWRLIWPCCNTSTLGAAIHPVMLK